jgi:hypothetical protein
VVDGNPADVEAALLDEQETIEYWLGSSFLTDSAKTMEPNNNPLLPPDEALCDLSDRGRVIALEHFKHVEAQVALAATTAGLIVTADALIIAAYVEIATAFNIFATLGACPTSIFYGLGGALIIGGLLCALYSIAPNLSFTELYGKKLDVVYFAWIGHQENFETYRDAFLARDGKDGRRLDYALLYQIWRKSKWLRRMFISLQAGIACTLMGTLMTAGALIIAACKLSLHR